MSARSFLCWSPLILAQILHLNLLWFKVSSEFIGTIHLSYTHSASTDLSPCPLQLYSSVLSSFFHLFQSQSRTRTPTQILNPNLYDMRETVDAFTTDRIVVNDPDQLASLSSRKAVKLSRSILLLSRPSTRSSRMAIYQSQTSSVISVTSKKSLKEISINLEPKVWRKGALNSFCLSFKCFQVFLQSKKSDSICHPSFL